MKYYTKEVITQLYLDENPNLTQQEAYEKAVIVHRALNTLDVAWRRSNKKFYSSTLLLSQGNMDLVR